jgi:two-component system phosphate regulon sensor histidine kinase PhoR
VDDGFLLLDRHFQIVMANAMATRYLGENLIGMAIADVLVSPQLDHELKHNADNRQSAEMVASSAQDDRRRFRVRLRAIDDHLIGVLIMDMTLQHNLEKVRRDFVANVSHELRSPLTSLIGFIETMQSPMPIDDATRARFLAIMDEEARRMSRLINDLLSLSRVETEEHISPTLTMAIDKVVQSAIMALSNRAQKLNRTIFFRDKTGRGKNNDDDIIILGVHDEMMEVFHNLLDNAIKYGFDNTDITVEMTAPDQRHIAFTVINQGEGIEEQHLSRLTERFYRADKSRSRKMGGTGLGLAIVKHIVNRHRGKIDITSEIGGQTRFTITLPLA